MDPNYKFIRASLTRAIFYAHAVMCFYAIKGVSHFRGHLHAGTFKNCSCSTRKIVFARTFRCSGCTQPSQAYAVLIAKPKALSSKRRDFRRIYERYGPS
ncbi:hypothetical protein BT93_H3306 [Corymbia citriodora subsp. variegata]|nr:hypothetical protein BT93_H3306 [Corymbia citriodora subsp. variegata]